MQSTFNRRSRRPAIIAILTFSFTLLAATASLAGQPGNSSNPSDGSATQEQQLPPPSGSSNPSVQPSTSSPQPSKQSTNPMESDQVDVEDVYPEYCRIYFPSRGTVSLFDYRERMYRCLHGPDRWFF
ncbi:hypothetical protein [Leptodesmis sp.]|uniref:hypothetical protein n=1 Tax=Leptodesmis sp. TaxID=3100501 RepID=UPI0040534912